MLEPVEFSHDPVYADLHIFGGHGRLRLEEREISVVVFPAYIFAGVDSILAWQTGPEFRTRQGDRKQHLDSIDFCFSYKISICADTLFGRDFERRPVFQGVA